MNNAPGFVKKLNYLNSNLSLGQAGGTSHFRYDFAQMFLL